MTKTEKKTQQSPLSLSGESLFRGEEPSFWNFWRDGVTSSFADVFDTDKVQCYLEYVQGYSSRKTSMALEYGSCIHFVMERAYSQKKLPNRDMVGDWITEYEEQWNRLVPTPTVQQIEQQEMVYGLAHAVLPTYFIRYDGDFLGKYSYSIDEVRPVKWLKLETVFRVPYVFPDGKTTWLTGKQDGLFESARSGTIVFDTKGRGQFNEELAAETMPFDFQFMFYAYAEAVNAKLEKRRPPRGVTQNVVRRPMLRQKQSEGLPEFLRRVRSDVEDPERWNFYFARLNLRLGVTDVDNWKVSQLDPFMQEVRGWWDGTYPHRLRSKGLIQYQQPCRMYDAITRNDYTALYKREHVFPELADL